MPRPRPTDLQRLEDILRDLARVVPGYPLELAFLARLSALLEKHMTAAVNEALRPLDLTYVLYQSMMIIHASCDGVATPSQLALLTGERPNNVTHICNHLATQGLISRSHASADRRRIEVSLTSAGRRLLRRAQPRVWAVWQRRFEGVGVAQRAQLSQLLRLQIDNLDRPASGAAAHG